MKAFLIMALAIVGTLYLYMVLAVETDKKEFRDTLKLQPDSLKMNDSIYHFKKAGVDTAQ